MENPFETNQLKRPTFLTVLCILTFIGSGWGVLSQLFSLLFTNLVDVSAQTEQLNTMMDNMESGAGTSFLSGILEFIAGGYAGDDDACKVHSCN